MHQIDVNYFPGWVRKSVTFTIDDGNLAMDEKFLSIVKPAGIKGTFNLCTPLKKGVSDEEYRRFYLGYEISNHCRRHPHAFNETRKLAVADEDFDEATADPQLLYRTEEEGLYRIHTRTWNYFIATDDKYISLTEECSRELEAVFGAGSIKDFVWPFGDQMNPALLDRLIASGFRSIRATGDVGDSTGFSLPADRMRWSYNAHHRTLLEVAAQYDAYPDDGELKFFSFGVHSIDFERDGNWDDLSLFCETYGNRDDFWYASVGDVFDYEDAVKAIVINEKEISNPSPIDLYVKIDGKRRVLAAYSAISL